MLCVWRIYTSVQLFFQFFHQWISTFVRVDKNCVFTLENVIYLINIHLCMNVFQFFHWRMSTFVCVDKNGVSYTWICFYLKNIHLCTSWLLVFSTLKNIFYLKNVLFLGECFIEGILSNSIIANSHRGKYSSIKENEKQSHKGVYSLSGRHFQVWKCHYTQFAQRWIFFNKRKLKTLAQSCIFFR